MEKLTTDNHVLRLHYRATVIIFLAAIALVSDDDDNDDYDSGDTTDDDNDDGTHDFTDCPQITSGQFIGNPIHCMSDSVSE